MLQRRNVVIFFSVILGLIVGVGIQNTSSVEGHLTTTFDLERISLTNTNMEGNSHSFYPSITANNQFVIFESWSDNLVNGDNAGHVDVFLRDVVNQTTTRLSNSMIPNVETDDHSFLPRISADGRFATFSSRATNLISSDMNDLEDVFKLDIASGTYSRVSKPTFLPVEANDISVSPHISEDGRYVVFSSDATNLVASDLNGVRDVFIRDTIVNSTRRVSVNSGGVAGNDSSDSAYIAGNFVTFASNASNLVLNDTNNVSDIFIYDITTNNTSRISIGLGGDQANGPSRLPKITPDGRYVIFGSAASNLVPSDSNNKGDVFVFDRVLFTTTRVSVADFGGQGLLGAGSTYDFDISDDGQRVAFTSVSTNLTSNDTNFRIDAFVHDIPTKRTRLVSVQTGTGVLADDEVKLLDLSPDGEFLVFSSIATNLVLDDTNGHRDIFMVEVDSIPFHDFYMYSPLVRNR